MKNNDAIEREMDRVDEEISKLDFSSWFRLGFSSLLWLAAFYIGTLLGNYYPMIAAPICLAGFGLPILGAHDCFTKRNKIKFQKLYLEHLENIVKNGVDKTTERIDQRRVEAIERHEKALDRMHNKTLFNTITGSVSILAWVIGAIVAYFATPAALVSALGIIGLGGIAYKSFKENGIINEELMRIDAIHSDLVYGNLYPKEGVTQGESKDYFTTIGKDKVIEDNSKKRPGSYDEQVVNDFIEDLENQGKEGELNVFPFKRPYVKK